MDYLRDLLHFQTAAKRESEGEMIASDTEQKHV